MMYFFFSKTPNNILHQFYSSSPVPLLIDLLESQLLNTVRFSSTLWYSLFIQSNYASLKLTVFQLSLHYVTCFLKICYEKKCHVSDSMKIDRILSLYNLTFPWKTGATVDCYKGRRFYISKKSNFNALNFWEFVNVSR